ncbi:hydroxyacid dehydrogenase [Sulfobacillus sp. hq2]|uniref:hydroxyacid dehydrogenase n=1 Tax=Sulfobacillus TaxID=28033 RepID=UPI000CD0C42E|nr:hydroxyacid dehydrogenase [Sulfobacillus sp. hq2]POB11375.1 phosphoglycerate dehydrogenase [Sulfobacillus sp. hq2]
MIVISEVIHPVGLELLRSFPVYYDPDLYQRRAELLERVATADALIVRNHTAVDAELLRHGPHILAVGRLGVGLNNLDIEALRQRGIAVIVPYGANATAVAEYVLGSLIIFRRHLMTLARHTKEGHWKRDMKGNEVKATTLGIVGFGATGQAVAQRAQALHIRVKVHDPTKTQMIPQTWRSTSLENLYAESDHITLHVPLNTQTFHMINPQTLNLMRPDALIINTARGELVDEQALWRRLTQNQLVGAILDVREHEPPSVPDPLATLPNVWLTPHIAGLTAQSQQTIAEAVAAGVTTALLKAGKTP